MQFYQVWRSGLSQTYQHLEDEEQKRWEGMFAQEAVNAADPEHGDLATRQEHHWQSTPGKSEFFVAEHGVWVGVEGYMCVSVVGVYVLPAQSCCCQPLPILLSCKGSRIVGCVGVKAGATLKWTAADAHDQRCSLWRLSVAEAHRKQGIARALVAAVEAWAAQHGFHRVEALTANPQASAFYERCGYVVARPNDWGPGAWHAKDVCGMCGRPATCCCGKQDTK